MTPETYKYFLIGLFSFIIIGSFYLVFKSGFKLKKQKNNKKLFRVQTKEENRKDIKGNILIIGAFIFFLVLFDKCSN
jgi:dolichol kinase